MENQEAYERAERKVNIRLGFYRHLGVYLGVNILLLIINLATNPDKLWFQWPLLGWGIGVFIHALNVFTPSSRRMAEVKKRMVEKEMKKESKGS